MKAFFFGCWNAPGHFMWFPGGGRAPYNLGSTILGPEHPDRWVDGTLAPRRLTAGSSKIVWLLQDKPGAHRSLEHQSGECEQGYYLIHHINGFTFMSWWDRCQGDTRPGCNSTFILEGTHDAVKMFDELCLHFPHVVENLRKAEIPLRQVVLP